MRALVALFLMLVAACTPPASDAPSAPQQLAEAPAPGAAELAERQRAQDALLAAGREARAPIDPAAADATTTPFLAAPDRVISETLTEILPGEGRFPRHGGSAAVLLADPASPVGAAKNLALCRALFAPFDAGGRASRVGAERTLYWPTQSPAGRGATTDERCAARLEAYDFARRDRLLRKLGLTGAGPFLIAERHDLFEDVRVAAVIDLARTPPSGIDGAVHYFRDRLLRAEDPWAPARFEAERARGDIASFLHFTETDLTFAPRLVRAVRAGDCPLTDLMDSCGAPAPPF